MARWKPKLKPRARVTVQPVTRPGFAVSLRAPALAHPPLLTKIRDAYEEAIAQGVQLQAKARIEISPYHKTVDQRVEFEIHASALAREPMCARAHVIRFLVHEDTRVGPTSMVRLDHGTAIHALWKAMLLWSGLSEPVSEDGELMLLSTEHSIVGMCDSVIVPMPDRSLFELKSTQHEILERMKDGPMQAHVRQVMLYVWLFNDMLRRGTLWVVNRPADPSLDPADVEVVVALLKSFEPIKRAWIVYHDKNDTYRDSKSQLPLKAWNLRFQQRMVGPMLTTAKLATRWWRAHGAKPQAPLPERICADIHQGKCRGCRVRVTCFQVETLADVHTVKKEQSHERAQEKTARLAD